MHRSAGSVPHRAVEHPSVHLARRYKPPSLPPVSDVALLPRSDLSFSFSLSGEKMYGFEAMTFNVRNGYLEVIVRGHRFGLLITAKYKNLHSHLPELLDGLDDEWGPSFSSIQNPVAVLQVCGGQVYMRSRQ